MVPSQSGWAFAGLPPCPSRVLCQFTHNFYEIWNDFEVKEWVSLIGFQGSGVL